MSTVVEGLTLLTPRPLTARHRTGLCLCDQSPGPDPILAQVVSLVLPRGIEAIVVDAHSWAVVRVALAPGDDCLSVGPFEQHLRPRTGEWLWLCREEIYF